MIRKQAKKNENRGEEESFLRSWIAIIAITAILCIISRAPTLIEKFNFEGFSLLINVGYAVVFGPFIIAALVFWKSWSASRLSFRESRKNGWLWLVVFLMPSVGIAFLLVQFVFEMTPIDASCEQFEHIRFLWDFSLFDSSGIKPIYCFGVKPEKQAYMPYIYPPVQSWIIAVLGLLTARSGVRVWKRWSVS